MFLVQATSDQAPLVWAKSIRGLNAMCAYQAPYTVALTPLEKYPLCSYHCQMLWVVPRHLVTVPSQDPTTRSSWCSTSCGS